MLYNANKTLRVEEEFDQYSHLDGTFGVYFQQGIGVGGAPCTEKVTYNPFDEIPGCGSYLNDWNNQIKR